jgi:transcriptional regulator with XRE-family HTH domain
MSRRVYTPAEIDALPALIRSTREANGISMRAAALSIGVAGSTWWNWENAGIVPDARRIAALSAGFGIDAGLLRAALRAARARQGPPRTPWAPEDPRFGLKAARDARRALARAREARAVAAGPDDLTEPGRL